MIGIVGGISADIMGQPVVYIKEAQAFEEVQPKEVRLVVVYDWNKERIDEEIDKIFPDAPIMKKVLKCESDYDIHAYNPTNDSHDSGLLQISKRYHGKEVERLGLDMENPIDNIVFARILYDRSGLQPWSASKHCWNK